MIEATTIDALSSIALLIAITWMHPTKRLNSRSLLDNARYHHARAALQESARQARVPDQGALHSELLPAPRSDRAVTGG